MAKMDDSKLKAIVSSELRRGIGYLGGTISLERQNALDRYYGRPYGNEIDGQSKVISTDVADVIEGIMPDIMEIFTASDKVVKFNPQGPEDEQTADQATDYVNHIFYVDNEGFLILHDWIKDALLQKLGVVKAWWEEKTDNTEETYEGLTDEEFADILADPEVEPKEHTKYPDPDWKDEQANLAASGGGLPMPGAPPALPALPPGGAGVPPQSNPMGAPPPPMQPPAPALPASGLAPGLPPQGPPTLHDVKLERTRKTGRVKIMAMAPEEYVVSPGARAGQDAKLQAHRRRVTRTQLIEEGFTQKAVDNIPAGDESQLNGEAIDRRLDEDRPMDGDGSSLDPTAQFVWVNECYIRVDYDGDGKAELRKITTAGPGDAGGEILENERIEEVPFYHLCPIRIPHKLIGRSLADLVIEIALIKTTLKRQLLNNVYLLNNPRHEVVDEMVNLDDLLTPRVGGLIRVKQPGMIKPFEVQPMIEPGMAAIEYFDGVIESQTGLVRNNQGLDPDSLHETAQGQQLLSDMANKRIKLIARVFAETGFKDLFRGILRLISKHQQKERMIRLRKEWTPMDPREWNTEMDMTINVGLGTGDKGQNLIHLNMIGQAQQMIMKGGNPGGILKPKNIYNLASALVDNSNLRSVEPFFTDPGDAPMPPSPPPPGQPTPEELQAKAAQAQVDQADAHMDMDRVQAQAQVNTMTAQAKAQQLKQDAEANALEHQVRMMELQRKLVELRAATALGAGGQGSPTNMQGYSAAP